MKSRIVTLALFLTACGSGPCREQKPDQVSPQEINMTQNKPNERVRVYKPDGSLQCGQGKAIPVGEMKNELKDISVFASENKADGLMHMQMCGAPTGKHNVYEINRADLEKAKSRGFKEWTWD